MGMIFLQNKFWTMDSEKEQKYGNAKFASIFKKNDNTICSSPSIIAKIGYPIDLPILRSSPFSERPNIASRWTWPMKLQGFPSSGCSMWACFPQPVGKLHLLIHFFSDPNTASHLLSQEAWTIRADVGWENLAIRNLNMSNHQSIPTDRHVFPCQKSSSPTLVAMFLYIFPYLSICFPYGSTFFPWYGQFFPHIFGQFGAPHPTPTGRPGAPPGATLGVSAKSSNSLSWAGKPLVLDNRI